MKFTKVSQLVLVSALGLVVASVLAGCAIVTIDYVFVACASGTSSSSTSGQIQIYAADAETGALREVDTAVDSGGSSPVALATTADYANLYAANAGNNSLVHFAIADDGSLTKKDSVTLPFAPTSIAVNTAGSYIFAVGGTDPGEIAVYSLSSGTIGSLVATTSLAIPGYTTDLAAPTSVDVLAYNSSATTNGEVYVAVWDQSAYYPGGTVTSNANPGWIFGFSIGSGGALTALTDSPYEAGVKPVALASDPTNRFLYAADYASSQLIGYTIQSSGVLTYMVSGPYKTGSQPTAAVVDPRGLYIYAANSLSDTVSAFAITLSTGAPTAVVASTGSSSAATDTDPVAVLVDPALGRFVYTANYVGNSISGFRLDPNTGTIAATQATPYPTADYPTALAAIPHGNHAVQSVAP